MTRQKLAVALWQQGMRSEGSKASELLEVRTREESPQDWVLTQNALGLALHEQAIQSETAKATECLAKPWPRTAAPWK